MLERMILSQKTKLLHIIGDFVCYCFVLFFFQKDKIQLSENNFGTPTCPSLCDAIYQPRFEGELASSPTQSF